MFDGATDLTTSRPVIELAWVKPSDSHSLLPWASGSRLADARPHHYDARSRFTLAHEIGHVLLHRLSQVSDTPHRLGPVEVEKVCDSLAARILMPEPWFVQQVGTNADLRSVRRTSLRAGTSLSATIVRCRSLSFKMAAIFLSKANGSWFTRQQYGFHRDSILELDRYAQATLEATPMKVASDFEFDFVCGSHKHVLEGQLRRTFSSAVLMVSRADRQPIPSPQQWQCHSRSAR